MERTFVDGLYIHINDAGAKTVAGVVATNTEQGVTWLHSYVSDDHTKTFCVYDGPSPEAIRQVAERNGDPRLRRRLPPGLDQVKHATARYHQVAIAQAAGYGRFVDVDGVACIEMPGMGAMGVHYVNGSLVGAGKINELTPEAVVYEPDRAGHPHLVAVEYIVIQQAWDANHRYPPHTVRSPVRLHPEPQPIRPSALLLPARVGVEEQPRRVIRHVEPARQLHRQLMKPPNLVAARCRCIRTVA